MINQIYKLNRLFRRAGFEVKLYQKPNFKWLQDMNIATIVDIGANVGQFALEISEVLPRATVHSFEPIDTCYEQLKKNTQAHNVITYPFALGDASAQNTINVHAHSPSSSLMKMGKLHKDLYPFSSESVEKKIIIKRLDDVLQADNLLKPILIKIDVQGFEDKVILGGPNLLNQAQVVLVEMSYEELYEGQALFDGIYEQLRDLGYSFKGNLIQTLNPKDGRIIFSDSIFLKIEN